ncbi:OmpA family protein [Mucilaginibacter pedocola]|uniref:Flagellar motor protein MotB n=1 Tax=Mucilaginibacter pedocola TaxID=1792845 RepID=A0A1S9PMM1_9SPHI|nr:OmpA family protein [Mucilaginibacter pedocola]OOQ62171.1 flagellar motor protein MotB [Mucilaginibacter pedocola]
MKTNLKKASMLLTGLMVGSKLFAQTPDTTGTTKDYVQPFSGGDSFRTWSIGVHGGVLTPYTIFGTKGQQDFRTPQAEFGYGGYIKKQILPSFGLQADFLAGKVKGKDAQAGAGLSSFETKMQWSAALSGNLTLANINWRHKKGVIQPYVTFGGGILNYKPVVTNTAGVSQNFKANDESIREFYIPVGAGLKFNLGSGVNLDMGYTVGFVASDNFDGYNYGGGSDKFSYGHIGLEFALGKSKKPQLATHNPVNSMRTEYLWQNQQTKEALQAQIDAQNAANAKLRADLDATNANLAKFTADSDGDGVPDLYDKCPNTPAGTKVDGSGCPLAKPVVIVTEEDKRVVKDAINNLEFDLGKATIRPKSFPSLDRVARLLTDKNFSLKLAGHTDNTGSDALNLRLSKDRAESIKSYLVSKGANPSRIEATGYGESQPIATNATAAGRQANRRVEFTLY